MTERSYIPRAGDLVWLNFDPRVGHEQSGHRPALVISEHETHRLTGMAIVCPITSQIKGKSFELPIAENKISGAVLCLHVKSVDLTAREIAFVEKASNAVLQKARRRVGLLIGV